MNILLDTNVLLSAAFRNRLPEKVVRHVATTHDIRWIVTPQIVQEYVDILRRPKFGLSADQVQEWADLIATRTKFVADVPNVVNYDRDPKDAMFLAAAIATQATFLITGDNDLLQAKHAVTTTRTV